MTHKNYTRLKAIQASVMDDLCNIYRVTLVSGTYGTNVESRSVLSTGVACGIEFTNGKIVQRGQAIFVDYDAILRIADTVPLLMTDEIELIEKGEFLISGTFKPNSAPTVSSSVQHIQLKRQMP